MKLFKSVPIKKPTTSVFDLSHDHAFTCKSQQLLPIYIKEMLPGTSMNLNLSTFARLQPLIAPTFGKIRLKFEAFYVPNRILMDGKEWEQFITGGINQDFEEDSTLAPYIDLSRYILSSNLEPWKRSKILDFFGIRAVRGKDVKEYKVSIFRFLAYFKIWLDWYVPEALMSDDLVNLDFNDIKLGDNTENPVMRRLSELMFTTDADEVNHWDPLPRYLSKDYFTSALPEPQSGTAVAGADIDLNMNWDKPVQEFKTDSTGYSFQAPIDRESTYADINYERFLREGGINTSVDIRKFGTELSATGFTIPKLRLLAKLQRWLEKNAVAGNRYSEQLAAHFGVRPKDARLQRSQFLGRYSQDVQIGDIPQTFGGDNQEDTLGRLGGRGTSAGTSGNIHAYADEHGYIMVMCSVVPQLTYSDGVDRDLKRLTRFDYAFPEFAHLGEQEVFDYEISPTLIDDKAANAKKAFGYQSRYSEYKCDLSRISGDFRRSLPHWTLSRRFDKIPALNPNFLIDRNAVNQMFYVVDGPEDPFLIYTHFDIKAKMPLPYYGTPML